MRKIIYLFLVYNISANFDFHAFIVSARQQGIELESLSCNDSANGSASAGAGKLTVELYEVSKPKQTGKECSGAQTALAAPLSQYEAALASAVAGAQ